MMNISKRYDLLFRIGSDFVSQILDNIESQNELAARLRRSKGRISQTLNDPGNLTLETMINYAHAINMKVGVVLYDKNNNDRPIHPDIFRLCWEKLGAPRNFWALKALEPVQVASNRSTISNKNLISKKIIQFADNRPGG